MCKDHRYLYASFATPPVSDFDCTCTWDLTAFLILNSGEDWFLFHCSLCVVRRSWIRIWRIDFTNWELFETCQRYSYITEFLWFRVLRVWRILTSNRKRNYRPIVAAILRISVPSIGAILQAYWEVLVLWRNTSCVRLSWPAIACVLLRKQWYFSILIPLWFPRARGQ